jgi:hypothetical protein
MLFSHLAQRSWERSPHVIPTFSSADRGEGPGFLRRATVVEPIAPVRLFLMTSRIQPPRSWSSKKIATLLHADEDFEGIRRVRKGLRTERGLG